MGHAICRDLNYRAVNTNLTPRAAYCLVLPEGTHNTAHRTTHENYDPEQHNNPGTNAKRRDPTRTTNTKNKEDFSHESSETMEDVYLFGRRCDLQSAVAD